MKKFTFILLVIVTQFAAKAQNTYNVVIFAEDGDPFYAYVNGIRQNDKPETNIKVTDLNSEICNLRIMFENKALPTLKQNMYPEKGFEHSINIKRNMKKELKIRYFGKTELANATSNNITSIPYHTSENPLNTNDNGNINIAPPNESMPSNGTFTTSTTTTQTQNNGNGGININFGGMGVGVNINDPGMQTTTSTTVTSSTSSYTRTSTNSGNPKYTNQNTTMPVQNPPATANPVANGGGCSVAMNSVAFDKMKKTIADKPFSDTKMSTAKVATKNACLSVEQIQELCKLFSMDDDKLAFAKYAYNSCIDKANYYQVSSVFSFSTTTEELNEFLEKGN